MTIERSNTHNQNSFKKSYNSHRRYIHYYMKNALSGNPRFCDCSGQLKNGFGKTCFLKLNPINPCRARFSEEPWDHVMVLVISRFCAFSYKPNLDFRLCFSRLFFFLEKCARHPRMYKAAGAEANNGAIVGYGAACDMVTIFLYDLGTIDGCTLICKL